MYKHARIVGLSVVVALLLALVGVVGAQEVEPGEGAPIVWGNQRGSSNIGPLVPIRCSGVDCADPNGLMWLDLIYLDPETLAFDAAGGPGALANGWEISEDGLRLTVSLRDDLTWNDGEVVDAEDVFFTYQAIQAGEQIGLSSSYGPARADIVNAEIIDDTTIAFDFEVPSCLAVNRAALVPPLPAHSFGFSADAVADFDFTVLNGHPFDTAPAVTGGPFNFNRIDPGTAIYLEDNAGYQDALLEGVIPEGIVYLDVPDYNVMAERLVAGQAGDVNYIHEPSTSIFSTLQAADEAGTVDFFDAPGTVWHYVALNTADPSNPQPGLDENGDPIDQGNHPILGDVRVRQALQHLVDIEEIIAGAQNGNASPMVVGTIPNAFSLHPDLERRAFDADGARALLEEAGFVSTGEPLVNGGDGLRTCQGCEFAEEGTEMYLEIMAPDQPRTNVAVILQDAFAQVGIELEVLGNMDFNTMYDGNLGTQTFDMAVAGWRGGIPFNADQRNFFGAQSDIAGDGGGEYGFNFGSWYNAEFEELSAFIASNPGCDEEAILEAAYRVQEIQHEDQPYLFLYAQNTGYAARANVENFDPLPAQGTWNIDSWTVRE
jgi:peptide/nickel transport system substrate-binding protein